ncbi:MAG: ribose 5-phosphate isomerase B [Defluviitaleaceae bacterium]|nr:ribose 5-phosphate isomerase B [Defluviitaleaceae bacterium]
MKIAVGSDHVGFEMKAIIIEYLKTLGHSPVDFGTHSVESTDYPVYGRKVATEVAGGNFPLGILICGTGVGISIVANKVQGIRSVVCSEPYSAKLSRMHNDTNILAFGARVVGFELAKMIVLEWVNAQFEGEERHQRRVDMITINPKGD